MRGRTHLFYFSFPGQAGGAEHCPVMQPGLGDPDWIQLGE